MDPLLDGPARFAAGLGELPRQRLDDEARAGVGGWQLDDHILGVPGEQQRCLVFATAEWLMRGGRLGSAATAPGRQAR